MSAKRSFNHVEPDHQDGDDRPSTTPPILAETTGKEGSPRTTVAASFEGLELSTNTPRPSTTPPPPSTQAQVQASSPLRHQNKRLRWNPPSARKDAQKRNARADGAASESTATPAALRTSEVEETPGAFRPLPSSPPLSPDGTKRKERGLPISSYLSRVRHLSPPPSTPITSPTTVLEEHSVGTRVDGEKVGRDIADMVSRPISPLKLSAALDETNTDSTIVCSGPAVKKPTDTNKRRQGMQEDDDDRMALTWQESEITGHEIDAELDDDGEGINGIGFRPTAAIAHARSERRKQQVSEWRAREAREARMKRLEKRRGVGSGAGSTRRRASLVDGLGIQSGGDDEGPLSRTEKKRAVRFAD